MQTSQRQYLAQLRLRFWLDFDSLTGAAEGEQYFPDDLLSVALTKFSLIAAPLMGIPSGFFCSDDRVLSSKLWPSSLIQ